MTRLFTAIGIAIGAGALIGWIASVGSAGVGERNAADWIEPAAPVQDREAGERYVNALLDTRHFGDARPDESQNQTDNETDNTAAKPPRIAATSELDGVMRVSAYKDGGGLASAAIGGELPGGWIVENATLKLVTLSRDGEIVEIEVFPHDDTGS